MPSVIVQMSVDPKEQNAELMKLIGANKARLAQTQKVIRDLQKRAAADQAKMAARRPGHEKGS
jgi:hypothetical protein